MSVELRTKRHCGRVQESGPVLFPKGGSRPDPWSRGGRPRCGGRKLSEIPGDKGGWSGQDGDPSGVRGRYSPSRTSEDLKCRFRTHPGPSPTP